MKVLEENLTNLSKPPDNKKTGSSSNHVAKRAKQDENKDAGEGRKSKTGRDITFPDGSVSPGHLVLAVILLILLTITLVMFKLCAALESIDRRLAILEKALTFQGET